MADNQNEEREEELREKARIAREKRRNVLQNWSGFGDQGEKKITDKRVTFEDIEPETHYVVTHHEPSNRYRANLVKQKIEETRVKAINSLFEEGGLLQEKINSGEDITWKSTKKEIEHNLQQHFSYGINALIPIYTDELLKLKDKKEELNGNLDNLHRRKDMATANDEIENINESIRQTKIKIKRMVRKIRNAEYNINELIEQAGRQMELKKREKQYIQRQLQEYARETDPSTEPLAQAQWRNELTGRRRGLQEGELDALFDGKGGRKKKTRRMKKKNKRKTRRRKKKRKTRRRKKGGRRKTRRCVKL